MLNNNIYDLIILDIQMPEMDGYETTTYIKKNFSPPKNNIPILGMSANALAKEKEKCIELGMNDFITKPFKPDILFSKIKTLTGIENNYKEENTNNNNSLSQKQFAHIDLSILNKIYNNDLEKVISILELYVKNIPEQISNLKLHFKNNSIKDLQIIAHSLKTSLNYLGLIKLKNIAQALELGKDNNNIERQISQIESGWKNAYKEIDSVIKKKKA